MMHLMVLLTALVLLGCGASASEEPRPAADTTDAEARLVKTGAQVLVESGFRLLDGKRVGLIVNHTARVGEAHLIDRVHEAPNVELRALFGPESESIWGGTPMKRAISWTLNCRDSRN